MRYGGTPRTSSHFSLLTSHFSLHIPGKLPVASLKPFNPSQARNGHLPRPLTSTLMLRLHRSTPTRAALLLLSSPKPFSSSATVAALTDAVEPALTSPAGAPLEYSEAFPGPDTKYAETIVAIPRAKSGKSIAAKERAAGRVPSIVFEQEKGEEGGNKRLISVKRNQIWKLVRHLGSPFFLSRLFDLEVRSDFEDGAGEVIEKVRVLPRLIHLHPTTDAVLNVTFMRAPSSALVKVNVPLVFRGEDVCPGLRKGGYLQTLKRTVEYLCPTDIIPPYIDVDLSELDVNKKLFLRDLKVHPALQLSLQPSEPVCKIKGSRVTEHRKSK